MSRVALIGENSIGYVNALVNIWNNGDCAVLLDWRIPFSVATEMMIEADVHTCFIEKELFSKLENEILNSINFVTYEKQNNSATLLPNYIYENFQNNYSPNEAVVIYSSGTTGKSKGIILSHFAINTNADAIIDYMKPTENDCIYIAKTLSHSSTLTGELLVALKRNIKLVITPTIVPPRHILNNISKFNVTIICLNPTLLSMLADEYKRNQYDIFSLKAIYVSGSILSDTLHKKAHTCFPNIFIYNVYGLSETGPRLTAQRATCSKTNSVGKPIKDIEIAIITDYGTVAPQGEYGIIHAQTPSLFKSYIIGEEKHKSLYNGWLNTGDVGYIDSEGELHVVGRVDDVIIIDSHKIYPNDIQNRISEIIDVIECSVAKIEFNGTETIGCIYVSKKDLNHTIRKTLKASLMQREIPKIFLRCATIPKTRTGKIAINEVKKLLQTTQSRGSYYE